MPMVDIGTGLYAAVGVLMAMLERRRSGKGQFLDMTLYDAGIALLHPQVRTTDVGQAPGLTGNAHPNIGPYDGFPSRTVDVFLAIGNDGRSVVCAPRSAGPNWRTTRAFASIAIGRRIARP